MAAVQSLALAGYRMERLAAAFDRVMSSRDWKGPVHAVIAASEREVTEQAILTFTGTPPCFVEVAGDASRLIVTALGYRISQFQTPAPDDGAVVVPSRRSRSPRVGSSRPVAGSSAMVLPPSRRPRPSKPRLTTVGSSLLGIGSGEGEAIATLPARAVAPAEPDGDGVALSHPGSPWSDGPGRPEALTSDY